MSEITTDVVKHVANLARIDIQNEEKAQEFTNELDKIVDYAKQLDELQLSETEPMFHALDLKNVMREDVANEPLSQDEALSNSKSTEDGQFKVPKML
ncbi:Asp-tRNA(Asn)/Glu-tRNA(Gln) amidotransferase subunit GatC [Lacicoccus qingdaonensis]|uniref:Aspartyl/glutamyl-tRNA(Asn/Gln) amidotransferase subunit C n=1 Tax=Lacicoccus qingdaonensis TaxID=576118 RepID=A0A1G9B4K8_9BACL|nr:Asp-tRNA(Asn)/Glu-tRNA(Gln) amidotransferase subunit GatC [Salinicoccus qingdaonensis]SDK34461.1 aspartyl/glutamyl-tRNA(Asn/Gln) amidotransferase subunit C [Salinicoccus qingdaonensis]